MEALDLFRSGRLREALTQCAQAVKQQPSKPEWRNLLCQLLCFADELERADTHLDILTMQAPAEDRRLTLWRHLIRAAMSRREFYRQGRVPEFTEAPPEYVKLSLEASICLREGNRAEAQAKLDRAEEQRPVLRGVCDGATFEDMRDGDDLTASVLEVLTSNGKYFLVPFAEIHRVVFEKPAEVIDCLWRAARIYRRGGAQGVVYVPQLYFDSAGQDDGELQTGQATEFRGGEMEPARGFGGRVLLMDAGHRPLIHITEIEFAADAEDAPPLPQEKRTDD